MILHLSKCHIVGNFMPRLKWNQSPGLPDSSGPGNNYQLLTINGFTSIPVKQVDDLELEEITSADRFPQVIHGTYYSSWEVIKKSVST